MPRRRTRKPNLDEDDLDSEIDRTFDALEKDDAKKRHSSRRVSAVLRTQKDEDEERQKILMDMNARANEKENPAKNERVLEAMKIAVTKAKQLAARAFQEDLIDRLPMVVEKEPLQQAGSLLDASARIYSFRVDATHSEAYDVRAKLGKSSLSENKKDSSDGADDDGNGKMNSDDDEAEKKSSKDKTKKKKGIDEGSDSDIDLEGELEKTDIYDAEDLPVYFDDVASGTEDENMVWERTEILKKFKEKYDKSHESCINRRSKISMVVYDPSELNDTETGAEFCSHLYNKATHNFDEGSSSGLLMQNAITSRCGRHYMLHNSCRCTRNIWNEKIEGENLHEIWSGIEDAERLAPLNIPNSSVTSSLREEHICRNATTSQETTFMDAAVTASSNMQSIQKVVETVLNEALLESGSEELFRWRKHLQKKLGMDSGQFIALLAHSLRDLDPFIRHSFIRQSLIPVRKSYISRIADSKSGLTYAPIADDLEPFEESMCWKVYRMRWVEMENEKRSQVLKALPGENPEFNYFFARSAEQLFAETDNILGNLPVFRSIIAIEVPRNDSRIANDDQKALAGVLDAFRIGRGESLFKKKGDEFGRKIAQIPIATQFKRMEQQALVECENSIPNEHSRSVVCESANNAKNPSRIEDNDCVLDVGGFNTSFDNELEIDAEVALSHSVGAQPVTDDDQSIVSKQDWAEKLEGVHAENVLKGERTDAHSTYGDLHYVDEKRVANMAYSIVNDEAHWKRRKLDRGEEVIIPKERTAGKVEKVERKKAKKEEKNPFEIGDFDSMPLAVIRDRQKQAKRTTVLVKQEDEILKIRRTRVPADLLYKAEQFCHLAHVFSGDWDKVHFDRVSLAPDNAKEEKMAKILRQSIHEDLDPEEAIKNHLLHFNNYFDDSCSDQQSMSVPCGSDALDAHTDDDLFSDIGTHDNDDCETILEPVNDMSLIKSAPNFLSEADSGAEEAEIFGVKYSVRQRRINAPAVKRAIGNILSNAKLDADALNAEIIIAREQGASVLEGMNGLNIVGEDSNSNSLFVNNEDNHMELKGEKDQLHLDEVEKMNDNPGYGMQHVEEIVRDFKLCGRHTFSSVLVQLPSYLAGRTADDLSPINAFSVLLHLCNENNLELLQRKDDDGLIKPSEMGDFTIVSAEKRRVNRKRTASQCQ
ncbi:unnamed protein product [Thelazia callipaeda]|uniref:Condensin complex subunit 2 n=1 Tax=Thelazia callipaeda TaxID=103827 RepID=A0A0N5CML1_THECL|nr:unnamed protein product [Thelazia callipaeda]